MSKARDIASAAPAPAGVTSTELGYVDGVTSAIQTQIDSKIGQSTAINPTIVDAKGDIITATADNTPARLAVGTNGQVLTAASGQATGLQWATPASGGMTLLSTTTLSGTGVTISSISQDYNYLIIVYSGINTSTNGADVSARPNNGANANFVYLNSRGSGSYFTTNSSAIFDNQNQWASANTNNGHTLVIYDYSATSFKAFNLTGIYQSSTAGAAMGWTAQGGINDNTPITSLRIQVSSGTFNAGTVKIYGVK